MSSAASSTFCPSACSTVMLPSGLRGGDAGVRLAAGDHDLAGVLIGHDLVRIDDRLQNLLALESLGDRRQVGTDAFAVTVEAMAVDALRRVKHFSPRDGLPALPSGLSR